jgi:hypothetical protein
MAHIAHNVIQHDFGFPRVGCAGDAELEALNAHPIAAGASHGVSEQRALS